MLPLIELDAVCFTRDGRTILRDLSLRIAHGEHVAIRGANGSGKSTLLRIVGGVLWPDAGGGARRYSLDGVTQTASPLLVRPHLRMLGPESQERFLRLGLDLSLLEFVASGIADRDYPPAVLDAAERARCLELLDVLDLREQARRTARKLSHGMLRRSFVARALVSRPRLLALDEVTDGLDPAARDGVEAALRRAAAEGTTLVMVAHRDSALLDLAGDAYRLTDGALVRDARRSSPAMPATAEPATPRYAEHPATSSGEVLVALSGVDVVRSGRRVLHAIDWTLRRGEHWAIQGENGAGKSTLAGVVEGSTAIAAGTAMRLEQRRLSLWELKRRIVLLSDALQVRYDWALPVREVLASGFSLSIGAGAPLAEAERTRADGLMERFDLTALAGRDLSTLSFGQRRRALLARALVRVPDILILDEIFDGLDAETRCLLDRELARLIAAGTSVVVITHREDDIPEFVRKRFILKDGRRVSSSF